MLYSLFEKINIPHRQCGKYIVSCSKYTDVKVHDIYEHAKSLGIPVELVSASEMSQKLPYVKATMALYSPTSGIMNSHALIRYLEARILHNEGIIQLKSKVDSIKRIGDYKFSIKVSSEHDSNDFYTLESDIIVNAAGLYSDDVYQMVETNPKLIAQRRVNPCRGHYYTIKLPFQVDNLIYPVPDPNLKGLGIHITIDLSGRVRVGPDAEYIDMKDNYRLDETLERKEKFWNALSTFMKLDDPVKDKLKIDYVGIRSKLSSREQPGFRDFIIELAPGMKNFVNCIGIESPGLTSCLSIAQQVEELLNK